MSESNVNAESRGHIYNGITEARGNTPLVRLSKLGREILGKEPGAALLAKLESFNPMNSVKCRIGAAMIDAAERDGKLKEAAL